MSASPEAATQGPLPATAAELAARIRSGARPESAFAPSRALANAHAQTLYAAFGRWTRGPVLARQRLELPDGDFLDVDVARPAKPAAGEPWALVLHGLEGSSEAPYARGLARSLLARGVEACLLNYRGCSGEENRLPRGYHMGETADVRFALERLLATRAGRPCAVVGFSCGANLTMKLLGELGDEGPRELVAGVAVSPPFELVATSRHLDLPRCYAYRTWLVRSLRRKALAKIAKFPGLADARAIARATTFTEFDREYTARIHGFRDEVDYWERSSGSRYLAGVRRDLLLISALDDPFFPRGYVPHEQVAANPRLTLLAPERGGHVGFVAGSPLAPTWWAEERAAGFVLPRLVGAAASPRG